MRGNKRSGASIFVWKVKCSCWGDGVFATGFEGCEVLGLVRIVGVGNYGDFG